jgi:ubiquinone/menaquinone biosynthesis C-methylase UbiE
MAHRVCPFWVGYLLASPLRRWVHSPERILGPYVRPGMTVVDVGCAMGYFTLPLARMVGPGGRVVAVDVQPAMLAAVRRRAARAKVSQQVVVHHCGASGLELPELAGAVGFALAFAVVHEMPNVRGLFDELAVLLKPGGVVLVAEPAGHVGVEEFGETLEAARQAGMQVESRPLIAGCHAAVLSR